MNNETKYLLAAHIGGTKARVGLVKTNNPLQSDPEWDYQNHYPIGNYYDPLPLFQQFLKEAEQELSARSPIKLEKVKLEKACIAVAGPVENNRCELTNWNWIINGNSLAEKLSLSPGNIQLINDFEAVAYGMKLLQPKDFYPLQPSEVQEKKTIAVIGAATGMGKSFLVQSTEENGNITYTAYPTEGGHTNFAPRSHLEFALWQYMLNNIRDENQKLLKESNHISVERVVSGRGIVAIYRFLQDCQNHPDKSHWFQELPENMQKVIKKGRQQVQNQLQSTKKKNQTISEEDSQEIKNLINNWIREDERCRENLDPAAVIASAALKKSDPLCIYAMQIFLQIYGAELGNAALQFLPYGGLYMAGGITPQILPLIEEEKQKILDAFTEKGRLSKELKKIPLYVLKNLEAGLMGSAYYAEHKISVNVAEG